MGDHGGDMRYSVVERSNRMHWSHHCSCMVGHSMVERSNWVGNKWGCMNRMVREYRGGMNTMVREDRGGMNTMVRDHRGGMNSMVNTMVGNQRSCMNSMVSHGMWSQGNSWMGDRSMADVVRMRDRSRDWMVGSMVGSVVSHWVSHWVTSWDRLGKEGVQKGVSIEGIERGSFSTVDLHSWLC